MGSFTGFLYRQLVNKPKPLPTSVRLDGQTALITGANVGLGLDAAKELAAHGLKRLIITARNASKGQAAKEDILKTAPDVKVEVWPLDYDSFQSITDFGKRVAEVDRLDIAILNAGVKFLDRVMSKTGHEAHVQVFTRSFVLVEKLLALLANAGSFLFTDQPSWYRSRFHVHATAAA